ncbi:MAG: sugar phosphate isomerase/epimerase family protein [Methanoculleus sp.]|nr:sugar phosphate isomerase/epimerase [Methanomicrobiales archaeon]
MSLKDSIGCSTCCLMDRSLGEALDLVASRTRLAEIFSDGPHSLFCSEEICYSFDLRYTVHAPTADINIASDNEHLRRATIRVLADLAEVCDRIGAARLVIHPGHVWGEEVRGAATRALDRSLDDLADIQKEMSVQFAIENMGAWDICFFREPGFIDRLTALELGFTLDVGHAHVNGNLEAFLESGGAIHVHLHDNCGNRDAHLGCGEGEIDFSHVLQAIPWNTTKVIEPTSFDQYEGSLEHLRSLVP